jgi:2'-5' RNA ligase
MSHRLFVALDLPSDVRAALPPPPDPWRPVAPDALHLTLAFLGSQPAAGPVLAALPDDPPPAGLLRTTRLRPLPPRRPRVLAVECEDVDGACTALQAAVAAALVDAGLFEPERRRWLPHVTVGRARGPVDGRAPLPDVPALAFRPPSLTLYESRLGGGPARYEALRSWRWRDPDAAS